MIFVFLFLTYFLCIKSSRFIYLIRINSNVFLYMAEEYSTVYICHRFFIHPSVHRQLGYFYVLATVNSAEMNTGGHASFSVMVSSGYMPSSVITGSYGSFTPSYFKDSPYCSP